jgi:molybdopterin molybdotransferase
MLLAAAKQAGGIALDLGIAADEAEALRQRIRAGLDCDVLVLSGGVSAGTWDLVPKVLEDLGVQKRFHKLRLKPGKPLWFGTLVEGGRSRLVFGLPGNPVSTFVCFELFVRPALAAMAGRPAWQRMPQVGRLSTAFRHRGDRPTYHPATAVAADGPPTAVPAVCYDVTPLPWQGSADLRTLAQANALAMFPAGERSYLPGDEISLLLLN